MRRLVSLLVICFISSCSSTQSDIQQEMADNPPSTAGVGEVAIWTSSAAPLVPNWPQVKTWKANIGSCTHSTTGPVVSATAEDGLPVTIQVLQPSGQEARLAATVKYASDGGAPRRDENDEQLLIVSDNVYSPDETSEGGEASFSGGFVHARVNEPPPSDSSGTLAHVSWRCP
jgi:hypothetical protein